MKRWAVLGVAMPLAALAGGLGNVHKVNHLGLWKLSILTTEYGHWMALLGLVAAGVSGAAVRRPGGAPVGTALWLLVAVFYALPAVRARAFAPDWQKAMAAGADSAKSAPWFSVWNLWKRENSTASPRRVPYREDGDEPLYFDFYAGHGAGPRPWVVVVHEGGWDGGKPGRFPGLTAALTADGISVLDTSYRLAPRWPWPAARDDVRAVVAFAKERARELGLDPSRWALLGRSAGGQIAESVALPGDDPTLRALVALYAPADLRFAFQFARPDDILDSKRLLIQYLGGTPEEKTAVYGAASPIEAAGPQSPPTLLIHGAMDPLTWVEQSRRLKKRMDDRGARAVYLELPWATHAFDYNSRGPGGQIVAGAVRQFLNAAFQPIAAEGEEQ